LYYYGIDILSIWTILIKIEMGIISLNCIFCKEQVDFNSNVISLNCSSCNTTLSVQKSDDIIYLTPMNQGKKETEDTSEKSEIILIEQEVARLDREWILKKDTFSDFIDIEPRKKVIDKILGAVIIVPLLGFVIYCAILEPSFRLLAFIMIFVLILFGLMIIPEERRFEKAKQEYLDKREKMMRKLKKKKSI